MVLCWASGVAYVVAVAATLGESKPVIGKLATIGWATLGLGLNWLLGFLCVPL